MNIITKMKIKEQSKKFERYVGKIEKGDKVFVSAKKAAEFLKKRAKNIKNF